MQFQTLLSAVDDDINVYVYDTEEADIAWMLNASQHADFVIIDVDNCDEITKSFVSFMLAQPNSYYMTSDEITPWNLISRNRIYNLDWILEILESNGEDEEGSEEEDNEGK